VPVVGGQKITTQMLAPSSVVPPDSDGGSAATASPFPLPSTPAGQEQQQPQPLPEQLWPGFGTVSGADGQQTTTTTLVTIMNGDELAQYDGPFQDSLAVAVIDAMSEAGYNATELSTSIRADSTTGTGSTASGIDVGFHQDPTVVAEFGDLCCVCALLRPDPNSPEVFRCICRCEGTGQAVPTPTMPAPFPFPTAPGPVPHPGGGPLPTPEPTPVPTQQPTLAPTERPTPQPTEVPTARPTPCTYQHHLHRRVMFSCLRCLMKSFFAVA
jgi:hypothetical protein